MWNELMPCELPNPSTLDDTDAAKWAPDLFECLILEGLICLRARSFRMIQKMVKYTRCQSRISYIVWSVMRTFTDYSKSTNGYY